MLETLGYEITSSNSKRKGRRVLRTKRHKEEKGIAFVLAILLLLVVTVIGLSAVNTTIFDNMISGNKRASDQAFYAAEAGINEFLGRFQTGATSPITDSSPNSPTWRLRLSTTGGQGASRFVGTPNPLQNVSSLQTTLDFGVEVRHKLNSAGQVVFIGSSPVYIAESYGYTADGGHKIIEVEFRMGPSFNPPAAIYTEAPTDIMGSSTYIQGLDQCGSHDKPGIITTLNQYNDQNKPNIDISGNPTISGIPTQNPPNPNPKNYSIHFGEPNIRSIQDMIDYLKGSANFSYNYNKNVTVTGNQIDNVVQNWSNDTNFPGSSYSTTAPLSYNGSMNIVYFNMNGKELKLAGGSYGAGILLIDGGLEINGGFAWYGIIIVKGSMKYTGGGNKNITGGVLAGESVGVEIDVGGNAGIIYCSRAVNDAGGGISPYRIVRWRDIF